MKEIFFCSLFCHLSRIFFIYLVFLPSLFLSASIFPFAPLFFSSASWNIQIGVLISEELLSETQAFLCKISGTYVCVCCERGCWEDCGYCLSCCLINATMCAVNKCLGFLLGFQRRKSSLCSVSFPKNSWKITVFNISIFPAQMPKSS